ncbi:MAG: glycosyltransferase [Phycisphaerae bacterium]|nr:glycosyltransferase [Phycisphaerae bacterium]
MGAEHKDLHVVHVTLSIQGGVGGPAQSISALCRALARHGCWVDLVAADWGKAFGQPISIDTRAMQVHIAKGFLWKRPRLWLVPGFGRFLREVADGADIIHSDGTWIGMCKAAADVSRQLGIPQVISLRGELAPVCLRMKAWKKAIARCWYADRNLRRAACLHALTEQEAADVRAYGLANPVAVIPNGIDLESFDAMPSPDRAGQQWPQLAGKRVVLYVGRIHPIKGLEHLVRAWCRVAARFDDWHLVIAGPDEVGQRASLKAILRQGQAATRATFVGPAYNEDKRSLLAAAEVFVLPSLSEGFSMSLLEALACRLPAVFTPGCSFPQAAQAGAGLLAEPTAEAVETALADLMSLSQDQRRQMGQRGRKLVEEKYSWDHVAGQMAAVYRWLVGRGPVPAWVISEGKGSHAS